MPYKFTKLNIGSAVASAGDYVFKKLLVRMEPGLYDVDDNLIVSWDALVNTCEVNIEKDYTTNITKGTMRYAFDVNSEVTDGVKIIIPDSVEYIGKYSFATCQKLTHIIIGANVVSIGESAFAHCYGMRCYDFTRCGSVPTIQSPLGVFTGMPEDCEIRVPISLVDEWKSALAWSSITNCIVGV